MWAGTIMQASHMPLCQCTPFQNNSTRPCASPEPTPGSARAPRSRSAHGTLAAGAARTPLLPHAAFSGTARVLARGHAWGCAASCLWGERLCGAAPRHRGVPEPARSQCPVQSRSTGNSSGDLEVGHVWILELGLLFFARICFHPVSDAGRCPSWGHTLSGQADEALAARTCSGHWAEPGSLVLRPPSLLPIQILSLLLPPLP